MRGFYCLLTTMLKFFFTRLMALVYEALLLSALCLLVTALYYTAVGDASAGLKQLGLQGLLWLVMAAYFVRCWEQSGQTLPNQTWHLKVVAQDGRLLRRDQALLRFILASLLCLPFGLTFWWALVDKQHCYLHDRLLGSRLLHLKSCGG